MLATKARDLSRVLDLMSEDVLFLTPGREPFGKEEFRAAFETMKSTEISGTAMVQELQVSGDWAWLHNRIDLTVTPVAGTPVLKSGSTLTIFRKCKDGHWRLYRDANLVS